MIKYKNIKKFKFYVQNFSHPKHDDLKSIDFWGVSVAFALDPLSPLSWRAPYYKKSNLLGQINHLCLKVEFPLALMRNATWKIYGTKAPWGITILTKRPRYICNRRQLTQVNVRFSISLDKDSHAVKNFSWT